MSVFWFFSYHSVASEAAPALKVAITGKDTVTTDETAKDAISYTDLTPGPKWQTAYVPFTVSGDLSKPLITFYFAFERQTLEIGGVAVFNLGSSVTTDALKAAIAKLPATRLPARVEPENLLIRASPLHARVRHRVRPLIESHRSPRRL
ncbi:MAG: hypothetical protein WDO13_21520 [Verrucomicrobiota bacterium]